MVSPGPRAETFIDGDFEFAIFLHDTGGRHVDLVRYLGTDEKIIVPRFAVDPSGKRYRVVSFGRLPDIFSECVKVIILPDTIERIFRINCPLLEDIHVPDSVTEISPAGFTDCRSLRTIALPSKLEKVNPYTFDSCTSLEYVTFSRSIKTIAKYAFRSCTSLKYMIIPDNVKEIGRYAFSNCTSLKEVVIGSGVKSLHADMFEGCRSLESLIIGSGVRDIDEYAFANHPNLKNVVLSEGLKRISKGAFEGCTSLGSIVIPESVISLDNSAFRGCLSMKEIFVRYGNTKYASSCGCLYDVKGTRLILCPPGVGGTFDIPDHVTHINEGAFYGCEFLTYAVIPDSVKHIGYGAFSNCTGLKSVSIGKGVKILNGSVFEFCSSLSWVEMSVGLKAICDHAFASCTSLKRIELSDSVYHIDKYAFYGCTGLQSIKFGKGVGDVSPYAFLECTSLVEFIVDEDNRSFVSINGTLYTKDLKELVHYPSARKEQYFIVPKGMRCIRTGAILAPKSLKRFIVEDGNESFVSEDGVLFSKDLREIVRYPAGKGRSYSIPYGTLYISEDAFFGCSLRNMVIPDGVRTIGMYTFYGCTSLTSISLPGTLYSVMDHSFSKCSSLKKVYLRDTIETLSVGHCAFAFCDPDMRILSDVPGFKVEPFEMKGVEGFYIPEGELPMFSGTLGLEWESVSDQ